MRTATRLVSLLVLSALAFPQSSPCTVELENVPGFSPEQVYSGAGLGYGSESVDLQMGNLVVSHPSLAQPIYVSPRLSIDLNRTYNLGHGGFNRDSWIGTQWTMHLGRITSRPERGGSWEHGYRTKFTFWYIDPSGGEHALVRLEDGDYYYSFDGTNLRAKPSFDSDGRIRAWTLWQRNGTRAELGLAVQHVTRFIQEYYQNCQTGYRGTVANAPYAGWYVTRIEDTSGKWIDVEWLDEVALPESPDGIACTYQPNPWLPPAMARIRDIHDTTQGADDREVVFTPDEDHVLTGIEVPATDGRRAGYLYRYEKFPDLAETTHGYMQRYGGSPFAVQPSPMADPEAWKTSLLATLLTYQTELGISCASCDTNDLLNESPGSCFRGLIGRLVCHGLRELGELDDPDLNGALAATLEDLLIETDRDTDLLTTYPALASARAALEDHLGVLWPCMNGPDDPPDCTPQQPGTLLAHLGVASIETLWVTENTGCQGLLQRETYTGDDREPFFIGGTFLRNSWQLGGLRLVEVEMPEDLSLTYDYGSLLITEQAGWNENWEEEPTWECDNVYAEEKSSVGLPLKSFTLPSGGRVEYRYGWHRFGIVAPDPQNLPSGNEYTGTAKCVIGVTEKKSYFSLDEDPYVWKYRRYRPERRKIDGCPSAGQTPTNADCDTALAGKDYKELCKNPSFVRAEVLDPAGNMSRVHFLDGRLANIGGLPTRKDTWAGPAPLPQNLLRTEFYEFGQPGNFVCVTRSGGACAVPAHYDLYDPSRWTVTDIFTIFADTPPDVTTDNGTGVPARRATVSGISRDRVGNIRSEGARDGLVPKDADSIEGSQDRDILDESVYALETGRDLEGCTDPGEEHGYLCYVRNEYRRGAGFWEDPRVSRSTGRGYAPLTGGTGPWILDMEVISEQSGFFAVDPSQPHLPEAGARTQYRYDVDTGDLLRILESAQITELGGSDLDAPGTCATRLALDNVESANRPIASGDWFAEPGAGDVLTVLTRFPAGTGDDPVSGLIQSVAVHGGDTAAVTDPALRTTSYEWEFGKPTSVQIDGLAWPSTRREIDPTTGKITRSIDPSDVATSFEYDLLGRVTRIVPEPALNSQGQEVRLAPTEITYSRGVAREARMLRLADGEDPPWIEPVSDDSPEPDGYSEIYSDFRRVWCVLHDSQIHCDEEGDTFFDLDGDTEKERCIGPLFNSLPDKADLDQCDPTPTDQPEDQFCYLKTGGGENCVYYYQPFDRTCIERDYGTNSYCGLPDALGHMCFDFEGDLGILECLMPCIDPPGAWCFPEDLGGMAASSWWDDIIAPPPGGFEDHYWPTNQGGLFCAAGEGGTRPCYQQRWDDGCRSEDGSDCWAIQLDGHLMKGEASEEANRIVGQKDGDAPLLKRMAGGGPQAAATRAIADGLGRTVRIEKLNPGGVDVVQDFLYDFDGQKSFVSRWRDHEVRWRMGEITPLPAGSTTDFTDETTGFRDPLGRPHRLDLAGGAWTEFDYAGFETITRTEVETPTGPQITETLTLRDGLGDTVHVDAPAGLADAYTLYDPLGRPLEVHRVDSLDPPFLLDQARTFTYDARGLLRSESHPEEGATTYVAYDALGQLVRLRDANGTSQSYSLHTIYDVAGRPLLVSQVPDVGDPVTLQEYVYDETDQHGAFALGRLTTALSYRLGQLVHLRDLVYDGPGGSQSSSIETFFPDGSAYPFETSWSEDEMGQVVSLVYPGVSGPGPAVNYFWDHGKVTGIDSPSQVLLESASWSPAGLPLQLDLGDATHWAATYDAGERFDHIRSWRGEEMWEGLFFDSGTFFYDPASNPKIIGSPYEAQMSGGLVEAEGYAWDLGGRLARAVYGDGPSAETVDLTYDVFSNLTDRWGSTYPAEPWLSHNFTGRVYAGNRIQGEGFLYDAGGSIVQEVVQGQTRAYVWSAQNRLLEITQAGNEIGRYAYDTGGDRVIAWDDTGATLYVRSGKVLAEFRVESGQLTQEERFFYLGNRHLAMTTETGETRWYHLDHLGSPRALTRIGDEETFLVSRHSYTPYGAERPPYVPNPDHTHRFTGHERDEATGLDYMRARYYSPRLARFLSSDPARDGGNFYEYAASAPVQFIDPYGLMPFGNTAIGSLGGWPWDGQYGPQTWIGGHFMPFMAEDEAAQDPDEAEFYEYCARNPAGAGCEDAPYTYKRGFKKGQFLVEEIAIDPAVDAGLALATGGVSGAGKAAAVGKKRGWLSSLGKMLRALFRSKADEKAISALATRYASDPSRIGVLEKIFLSDGSLKMSNTALRSWKETRQVIPAQAIADTIGHGIRTADPQGVAGHFMYESSVSHGLKSGYLEVLVDEVAGQINHVKYYH